MIFAEQIDYINESYLNEAFNFKTKEEAERALEKVSNNEKGLMDYINWGFKFGLTPVVIVNGVIVIPIGALLINAFSTWMAFPGSAGDKLNKCNKIIKKCDRTLDSLAKKSDDNSKKLMAEYRKVREKAVKEKEKHEDRVNKLGTFSANYNESNVLSFSGNNGGSYMQDALYESYIQAKIDSEDRLAFALKENMVISEADYSNIRALNEAKLSDKIKSKWKKFIAFIKSLVAKFMESMSNILLDEKEYLEKYKDIILKKKAKDGMEYSYTGNYKTGIYRLMNTTVPLFNYDTYKKELESEDEADIVNKIMPNDFRYTDGDTLAEQFKSYFLAYEDGQKEGKFSDLKMIDLYNFCYNFNKIKGIVDKDINRLEASTRAIESAINKELNSVNTESSIYLENNNQENTAQTDQQQEDQNQGLKIKTSTDAISKMSSTDERNNDTEKDIAKKNAEKAKQDGKEANEISQAADKWINVCRPLISAKLTACQQISKDYMDIIRAHVRSYGGTDKKDKTDNTSPGDATKYSNNRDVEKAKAEKAKAEAEKAKQDQNKK